MRIWQHAGEYRAGRGAPTTWMASIVRHRALDLLRRPRLEHAADEAIEDWAGTAPTPPEHWARSRDARALHQPLGSIKSRIRRGLDRLERCLEP